MNFDDYERRAWADYVDLADTVAAILRAAIRRTPQLRLQQVNSRAKGTASLKKKLLDRQVTETANLADEIKDLAGCRIVFGADIDS